MTDMRARRKLEAQGFLIVDNPDGTVTVKRPITADKSFASWADVGAYFFPPASAPTSGPGTAPPTHH